MKAEPYLLNDRILEDLPVLVARAQRRIRLQSTDLKLACTEEERSNRECFETGLQG